MVSRLFAIILIQDIIDTYYQRISIKNNLQNII